MVGLGLIGSELVNQIKNQTEKLKKEKGIYIQVNGLSEVGKQLVDPEGIDLDNWQAELGKSNGPVLDLEEYVLKIRELNLPNSVLVDCTASEKVTEVYTTALNNEISIVTPNKKAASGSYATYKSLKSLAHTKDVRYIYEVNVGAGLPVISSLNDLVLAGDNVLKIEAILSGTLSYIFNTWDGSQKFSEVIKQAKDLGYTEPDPRDDLNGVDVARKVLILAREIGLKLELEDIEIENLVPEECRHTDSIEGFLEKMKKYDEEYQQKLEKAQENNQVLRYIAKIEDGKTKVSLESVDSSHPFYNMKGSDNIISYTTERYKETPLVIKGPGAGAGVTAGGLFADILRIAR
jgi:aspartokinase/homoserine dehydrogenase 1